MSMKLNIDVAVFSIYDKALHVLTTQDEDDLLSGRFLSGGEVNIDLDTEIESTAMRIVEEQSGVKINQTHHLGAKTKKEGEQFIVSIILCALVPWDDRYPVNVGIGPSFEAVRKNDALRECLNQEHLEFLDLGLDFLYEKTRLTTLPTEMAPDNITLPDLQGIFEQAMGEDLDIPVFRRRMLKSGLIEESGQLDRSGGRHPSKIYSLVKNRVTGRVETFNFDRKLNGDTKSSD